MKITPESPELTAYVLDALPPGQQAEVEAALQASPALAAEVEDLRQAARIIEWALAPASHVPSLDDARRAGILAAATQRPAALTGASAPARPSLPPQASHPWPRHAVEIASTWWRTGWRTWWPVAGAVAASAVIAAFVAAHHAQDRRTVALQELRYQRLPAPPQANRRQPQAMPATPKDTAPAGTARPAEQRQNAPVAPPAPSRFKAEEEADATKARPEASAKAKASPAASPDASEPQLARRYGLPAAVPRTAAPSPAPSPAPVPPASTSLATLPFRPTPDQRSAKVSSSFAGGLASVAPTDPMEDRLSREGPWDVDRAGGEGYAAIQENVFRPVATAPLSTFGLDVDTASYANVRRFLREGTPPPRDAVRVEEMINYFRYHYPEPQGEHPVSVSVEVAESPWREGCKLVRVGIQARSLERAARPPANLVFLVDVSGSMAAESKLPLVKRSLRLLLDRLDARDHVALVTYAAGSHVLAEPTAVDAQGKATLLRVLDRLKAGNGTHGSAGIEAAYALAAHHLDAGRVNRVILCTDGDFNIGATHHDDLLDLITRQASTGVFLTVLGYGMGNYQDATMELLADKGNGQYAYIDSFQEARKVLGEELESTLVTVAKDVKAQVEFNPARARAYRLVGYENRALRDRDFADDTKDGGELGAGHQVTVLYEVEPVGRAGAGAGTLRYQATPDEEQAVRRRLKRGHEDELLVVKLRYKQPDGTASRLVEVPAKDADRPLAEASPDTQFAVAVASQAMLLRGSAHRGTMRAEDVLRLAERGVGTDREGYRSEFVDLARRAMQLTPGAPGRPGRPVPR